jgi:hypothetical protein
MAVKLACRINGNTQTEGASFEASTAMMFQVEVFWVATLCSVMVGYQRFRGQCSI